MRAGYLVLCSLLSSGGRYISAHNTTTYSQLVYCSKHASMLVVVWLSGNALVVINEVTLRQARLILG